MNGLTAKLPDDCVNALPILVGSDDAAMPAIERIYNEAFPESERRPSSWLVDTADRSDFSLIVAEQDDVVVGFATLFEPSTAGEITLLDYLAVNASFRGVGVGGRLFQTAIAKVAGRPLLVEVESIGDPPDRTRQRRQVFYRRHSCKRIVGVPYLLPIPTVGKPPMELMIANAPETLTRTDLQRWLKTIYTQVYTCDGDDPRLAVMLSSAPAKLVLD